MTSILITGGTGFLGKHLLPKLQSHGYDIWAPSSKELDLLDNEQAFHQIYSYKPDIILHMAAICGGILANKNSPADFLHKNVDMASVVFHAAKEIKCQRVYTLGSVCAYPKFCPTPFKEENLWNGYPEETNAPYGMAKRLQLLLGQTYRQQYGIGGAHLIPVNMYGEYDHFDLTNSHVIPALIHKFDLGNMHKRPFVPCWGTGEATREFLYAGDAADAITKVITTDFDSPLPINLGTGKNISIKELASLIGRLMNYQEEIRFTEEVSDGQPDRLLDVSRAKELLGWTAQVSLKEGLKRTIEWYYQNKTSI
jgi:GDP-L-fucose synthase